MSTELEGTVTAIMDTGFGVVRQGVCLALLGGMIAAIVSWGPAAEDAAGPIGNGLETVAETAEY